MSDVPVLIVSGALNYRSFKARKGKCGDLARVTAQKGMDLFPYLLELYVIGLWSH